MTTKAQEIHAQIKVHYGEEKPNHWLLSNYLRDGLIDAGTKMKHKHDGYNSPDNYEEAIPLVMYFDDDSVLVVTCDRIFTAVEYDGKGAQNGGD